MKLCIAACLFAVTALSAQADAQSLPLPRSDYTATMECQKPDLMTILGSGQNCEQLVQIRYHDGWMRIDRQNGRLSRYRHLPTGLTAEIRRDSDGRIVAKSIARARMLPDIDNAVQALPDERDVAMGITTETRRVLGEVCHIFVEQIASLPDVPRSTKKACLSEDGIVLQRWSEDLLRGFDNVEIVNLQTLRRLERKPVDLASVSPWLELAQILEGQKLTAEANPETGFEISYDVTYPKTAPEKETRRLIRSSGKKIRVDQILSDGSIFTRIADNNLNLTIRYSSQGDGALQTASALSNDRSHQQKYQISNKTTNAPIQSEKYLLGEICFQYILNPDITDYTEVACRTKDGFNLFFRTFGYFSNSAQLFVATELKRTPPSAGVFDPPADLFDPQKWGVTSAR